VTLGVLSTLSDAIDIAMEIQRQLAAIELDIRIVPLALSDMASLPALFKRVDVLFVPVWSPDPIEDVSYAYRGLNIPGVSAILDKISEAGDENVRRELFLDLEKLVLEDSSRIILFWQPVLSAYRVRYCGFHMTSLLAGLDKIRPCS